MNRTPAEWALVNPRMPFGSEEHAADVLAQALADIATLAAELAATKKVAEMRLVRAIEGVRADGVAG